MTGRHSGSQLGQLRWVTDCRALHDCKAQKYLMPHAIVLGRPHVPHYCHFAIDVYICTRREAVQQGPMQSVLLIRHRASAWPPAALCITDPLQRQQHP